VRAYNFAASGSKVTKLFHATWREAGVLTWTQLLGKARPLKIWERKNRLKFGAISVKYRLQSRISPVRIHISKIGKVDDQLQPIPRWPKQDGEIWSTNKKVIGAHVDPPKVRCKFRCYTNITPNFGVKPDLNQAIIVQHHSYITH